FEQDLSTRDQQHHLCFNQPDLSDTTALEHLRTNRRSQDQYRRCKHQLRSNRDRYWTRVEPVFDGRVQWLLQDRNQRLWIRTTLGCSFGITANQLCSTGAAYQPLRTR